MRKNGILNQELLYAMGSLGHGDHLVVSDAGLPIPLGVERIDLTVVKNLPRFLDVLKPILAELVVEKIIMAAEIEKASPAMLAQVRELAGSVPIEFVSHTQFKLLTHDAKAVVRTGEHTPFSNVILQSGVDFR